MTRASDTPASARWPIWLLLAAWICANSPQAATYAFLEWAAEARNFSHQKRLTRDVAFLLAGAKAEAEPTAVEATPVAPPMQPAIPPEAVLKRLDLAMESSVPSFESRLVTALSPGRAVQLSGLGRPAPPHEPPRRFLAG
jgi:hypothetical protein